MKSLNELKQICEERFFNAIKSVTSCHNIKINFNISTQKEHLIECVVEPLNKDNDEDEICNLNVYYESNSNKTGFKINFNINSSGSFNSREQPNKAQKFVMLARLLQREGDLLTVINGMPWKLIEELENTNNSIIDKVESARTDIDLKVGDIYVQGTNKAQIKAITVNKVYLTNIKQKRNSSYKFIGINDKQVFLNDIINKIIIKENN